MKVTIVGCWGGYPAPGGATSAYIVEKEDFVLVIDFGSGVLAEIQQYKQVSDLDAVILSHYHHDHIADVGVLQYALLVQSYVNHHKQQLPIYGHQEDPHAFASLSHDYTRGVAYHPHETLQMGPFEITFLKTKHPVPCYGMRVTDGNHVLVYTADSAYDGQWIDFAKDADLFIADCNFYEGQEGSEAGHMNSQEAAMIARKAEVKHLVLSHLPQYGSHEQLVKEASQHFSGKITLAHEGFVWFAR